jgi:hypothetical protein
VTKTRDRILNDTFPVETVQVTKSLSKGPDEYKVRKKKDGEDFAAQPHIALARKMMAEGKEVRAGVRIAYVIVDGSKGASGKEELQVVPADAYDGAFDRYYMWENLVYKPTMRLMMAIVPAHNWKQYLNVRPPKPKKPRAQRTGSRKQAETKVDAPQLEIPFRSVRAPDSHYDIDVPGPLTQQQTQELLAVLARFPGRRRVCVCDSTGEVDVSATVSVTPAMQAAVEKFIATTFAA